MKSEGRCECGARFACFGAKRAACACGAREGDPKSSIAGGLKFCCECEQWVAPCGGDRTEACWGGVLSPSAACHRRFAMFFSEIRKVCKVLLQRGLDVIKRALEAQHEGRIKNILRGGSPVQILCVFRGLQGFAEGGEKSRDTDAVLRCCGGQP